MFLHDISDVAGDLLIIFNQMKLEGKDWFFLVEIQYVITTLNWFIFRNVMFATKLLVPIYKVSKTSECLKDGRTAFTILEVLLYCLYAMHFYWLYTFLRIGYVIITVPAQTKNRDAVYEGKDEKEE